VPLIEVVLALSGELHRLEAAMRRGYDMTRGIRCQIGRLSGRAPLPSRPLDDIVTATIESPIGPLLAAATARAVCMIEFPGRGSMEVRAAELSRMFRCTVRAGRNERLEQLEDELSQYFASRLRKFMVPIEYSGTPFQVAVWRRLLKIPYGKTVSYEQLAAAIGKPTAQRAVGTANGRNRISIVIPCHRVVKKDGKLGGYGGGLRCKQFLLDLERGG
jgi:AraC family transcriptional regulator, regulatory protein of adaptative response / methylated-DNA-[protein]-cysteine methyltransferase